MSFLSINALRFVGCVVVHGTGYNDKSLRYDRSSKDISKVSVNVYYL